MRFASFACLTATIAVGTIASSPASAQQLRYTTTKPGGIAAIGNTLGLSKQQNANGPGFEDSIGTFITLDDASVDLSPANAANPWFANTTNDWTLNGSEAVLNLPDGADVLYAELIWAGSYDYIDNVLGSLDVPVVLSADGDSVAIDPDPLTVLTIDTQSGSNPTFDVHYYMRSANVTGFVTQHLNTVYSVEGVPGTQHENINALNAAGWTLLVAYRADSQPIRNLSIFVGGSFVDEDSSQDYTFSGFCAPPVGVVEGNIVVSALEGDADLDGDELLIQGSGLDFVPLSGPNNPTTNFFCSQINDGDGLLDISGSFGDANHDPFLAQTVSGGRQGWDLTTVAVSSLDNQLSNDQTEAVIRTNTTGDSFMPVGVAFEIDVKSPDFGDSLTTATPDVVTDGNLIVVTAKLVNTGEAPAVDVLFHLPVDGGLELTDYSTDGFAGDIDGAPVAEADLAIGVPAGDLDVGEERNVVLGFEVVGAPQGGASFLFSPQWSHSFVVCDGDQPIDESHTPPTALVSYDAGNTTGSGGAGGMTSASGGMGGDGLGSPTSGGMGPTSTGNGNNDDGGDVEEDGGCGCRTPGGTSNEGAGAALAMLLGLGLWAGRRRRD